VALPPSPTPQGFAPRPGHADSNAPGRLDRTARENGLFQRQASAPPGIGPGDEEEREQRPNPALQPPAKVKKDRALPAWQASCGMNRPLQGQGRAFRP